MVSSPMRNNEPSEFASYPATEASERRNGSCPHTHTHTLGEPIESRATQIGPLGRRMVIMLIIFRPRLSGVLCPASQLNCAAAAQWPLD